MHSKILRLEAVKARVGLGRSTIYALMSAHPPKFPHAIKISVRAVGWLESEIEDFVATRGRSA
jgi:prophage regulatory protein